MSRDPERERPAELMTAYVDGVAELPPDERHAVEAWLAADPAARADADAVQGLLGRLRALPPSDDGGDEPDWGAMERSIRAAVAAEPTRPWWRRWQWLVPAMTCATAAAVLVVLWPRHAGVSRHGLDDRVAHTPAAPPAPAIAGPAEDELALWLDGRVVDVELPATGALPSLSASAIEDPPGDIDLGTGPAADGEPPDELGLLPAGDLAWLDNLDDAALDRAERWLASPTGAKPGARGQRSPRSPVRTTRSRGPSWKKRS